MVLKGVNKSVVEINDTGCEYFEKAVFFVKPEFCEQDEKKLHSKAENITKNAARPHVKKPAFKQKGISLLQIAAGMATGAAVTGIISWIF